MDEFKFPRLLRFKKDDYRVLVNYDLSLEDMIKVGHYDWENENITSKNFPITGKGLVDIKLHLLCLRRTGTTKQIEEYLDFLGLKPAAIEHLLAFGAKYPDKQKKPVIIALGSGWVNDGGRDVPCLDVISGRRHLVMYWDGPDGGWAPNCQFFAISK